MVIRTREILKRRCVQISKHCDYILHHLEEMLKLYTLPNYPDQHGYCTELVKVTITLKESAEKFRDVV